MSRGFHAFFRQYYNLRALLRRTDPTLARLLPVDDYPAGARRRAARLVLGHPARPRRWNLVGLRGAQPQLRPRGTWPRVDVDAALGLLDVDVPARPTPRSTGRAPPTCSTGCASPRRRGTWRWRCSPAASSPTRASSPGPSWSRCSTCTSSARPRGCSSTCRDDDYDSTLWAPARRATSHGLGVTVVTGREVRSVAELGDGLSVLHGRLGHDEQDWLDGRRRGAGARPGRRCGAWSPPPPVSGRRGVPRGGSRWPASGQRRRSRSGGCGCPGRSRRSGRRSSARAATARSTTSRCSSGSRAHATRWSEAHDGSVVELHAYALPEGTAEVDLRQRSCWPSCTGVYPETAASTWCTTSGSSRPTACSWGSSRGGHDPACARPTRGCCSPATRVRCDLPVALMERAATTGFMAADHPAPGGV